MIGDRDFEDNWSSLAAFEKLCWDWRIKMLVATDDNKTNFDPTYNQRHGKRNLERVVTVIEHCVPGHRYLDVGCNAGYFSKALLNEGVAEEVDAIEVTRDPVDDQLLADSRFSLYEGDATTFPFQHRYTGVIYGAVHHHIFGKHGHLAAFQFWQKLVDHCDSTILFESGQLVEGSRWFWQRSIRTYYAGDEEYFGSLLRAVGPRLKGIRIVGHHRIHGITRWLLQISLTPPNKAPEQPTLTERFNCTARMRRTIGSLDQRLIVCGDEGVDDRIHDGIIYTDAITVDNGERVFCKKSLYDPYKDLREFLIASQVDHKYALRPFALCKELGLIYPFVPSRRLSEVEGLSVAKKKCMAVSVLEFFEYASEKDISIGDLDINPMERRLTRKLVDVIDFHAANIFVNFDGPTDEPLKVFDFEYFGNANASRNRLHVARMLFRLGYFTPRGLKFILVTAVQSPVNLLLASLRPVEQRICNNQVSVFRYFLMRLREIVDNTFRIVPGYWQ